MSDATHTSDVARANVAGAKQHVALRTHACGQVISHS